MGRYSYSHDDEVTPALKLNGSKLLNTHSPGDDRQHPHALADGAQRVPLRLQLLLQHLRTRAGLRARRGLGARHSRHVGGPARSVGHSEHRHHRVQRLRRQHGRPLHQPEQGVRVHRQPVLVPRPALVQGRRAPSGSITTTRSATSSRAARSSSTAGPRGRRPARRRRAPPRLPTSCSATCARSELAVALATTNFRAVSQTYYFTDTWRMRDNMTLDLGIRYEYVPPWLDKGGTLINAYLPFSTPELPVADLSRHPVLVRIGEGDFYEDSPIRFAPNIQTSRDGRAGRPPRRRRQAELRAAGRMGVDAERRTGRSAPASASSTCRTRAIRASTWRATRPAAGRTPPTRCS